LPVRQLLSPLRRFLRVQSAGGLVLLACAAVALGVANSPWAAAYRDFWHTPVVVRVGGFVLDQTLEFWVNDGLMTIFFFVVGLEIKRELVDGELHEFRKAALPVMGALGGMVAPALVYLAFHPSGPAQRGWGVPMATDIAFVVGVMALFGRRVPVGLKIFLLALAIVDDIGAVLVIAVAYTDHLLLTWVYAALAGLVLMLAMRGLGVRPVWLYVAGGAVVWYCCWRAGVHPTVAGVILGLMAPAKPLVKYGSLKSVVEDSLYRLGADETPDSERQQAILEEMAWTASEAIPPLERLERRLHPLVSFLIMPIFALANAGVVIDLSRVTDRVAWAVAAGLVIGKPLGIVAFSWLAVTLRLARLPGGVNWRLMFAAGCLGGIGFTMAIFIAGLAFKSDDAAGYLAAAKFGTLAGSVISAAVGSAVLATAGRRP
jgi:NhaA family Na+:H+ antiporter